MTYSSIADLQSRLPFTLNVNSLPTLANATVILENCNRFIKGIIDVDWAEPNEELRVVELELAVEQVRAIHSGAIPSFVLSSELKIIIDDHRSTTNVSFNELVFRND